ncbi:deoxyribodipyrimidine photo-lyase [Chryseobacterium sp. Leaf394]|uniref:deoxyribodipyrimidine photo-lyase n=1 Tax=Chryseobacterium sp. Leaf394 TaxID=1736361 RepID=UPI000ADA7150|nr:deoxyribodipyrimidine photo-lyase [Chryseobacterium sp. Leaf394]
MPKKQKINILWFRNDLRIRDSRSLFKISHEKLPFLAVYIFDETFYTDTHHGFRKIGKFRAKFLLETVLDLEKSLDQKNIPFLKKFGRTEEIFKQISGHFEIENIFCQREWTKEETETENQVRQITPSAKWIRSYSQLLLETDFVYDKLNRIPLLFTTFRQKIEKDFKIRSEFDSEHLIYGGEILSPRPESDHISMKTLGFDDFENNSSTAFPFSGGETEGWRR